MKRASAQMDMDGEAECDEPLREVVYAIQAKRSKDGHDSYLLMFAASPDLLLSIAINTVGRFLLVEKSSSRPES